MAKAKRKTMPVLKQPHRATVRLTFSSPNCHRGAITGLYYGTSKNGVFNVGQQFVPRRYVIGMAVIDG